MSHLVLLDNEAVQALAESTHPRHRRVLSHAHVVAQRTRRQAPIRVAVPTGVRVEAGWDRTAPASAFLNRLRVADIALDTASADIAAAIVVRTGVSVADAHLGAVMRAAADDQLTVITSDPNDMRSVAAPRNITTVAI
jgi:predicted nucleic acid-binding protein